MGVICPVGSMVGPKLIGNGPVIAEFLNFRHIQNAIDDQAP